MAVAQTELAQTELAQTELDWVEPLSVAAGLADCDDLVCLLSGGGGAGGRSFVGIEPDRVRVEPAGPEGLFEPLKGPAWGRQVVGLVAYDAGARPATGPREAVWPDRMMARYPALLAFDHDARRVRAIGLGEDAAVAQAARDRAAGWIAAAVTPARPAPPSADFTPEAAERVYLDAVADVVERIAAGELFQANIARAWGGDLTLGADPFDVFVRLALDRPSSYAAFWRVGDRAVVSNSPELFLAWDPKADRVETRPIKGTRGRHPDPATDAAQGRALLDSAKDRAENLMIVDLMRNDLARACAPGSVRVEALFALESHPGVHHLVSTVTGRPGPGVGAAELLEAAFPPGSITGAPKHRAMRVIAGHEPPRGAWCGSLFVLDETGGLSASVLIRTASFQLRDGLWRWRTAAGAGIVADSDPPSELVETDLKIAAIRDALVG